MAMPCFFASAMCASNERIWAGMPSASVRKKSRPVSPIARTRGSAASSSITAMAASSSPAASYAGASFGWIATAARTRGWLAAAHADQRDESTSPPAWTTPCTPTASARSSCSSSERPVSPSSISRWQWLS